MIYTTLNRIRAQSPCGLDPRKLPLTGYQKLKAGLPAGHGADDPVSFADILRISGADDAFWCLQAEPQHDRLWRMVAVRCARQVQRLMTDPRSLAALDVSERHAHGLATDKKMDAASAAAMAAARAAACDAASAAASAAAWDAAMKKAGEILLSAVPSRHADPGCLGERETEGTAA